MFQFSGEILSALNSLHFPFYLLNTTAIPGILSLVQVSDSNLYILSRVITTWAWDLVVLISQVRPTVLNKSI